MSLWEKHLKKGNQKLDLGDQSTRGQSRCGLQFAQLSQIQTGLCYSQTPSPSSIQTGPRGCRDASGEEQVSQNQIIQTDSLFAMYTALLLTCTKILLILHQAQHQLFSLANLFTSESSSVAPLLKASASVPAPGWKLPSLEHEERRKCQGKLEQLTSGMTQQTHTHIFLIFSGRPDMHLECVPLAMP